MKTFVQWFIILGAVLFLSWYLPVALADGRVYLGELTTISLNFAAIVINLWNYTK